MKQTVQQQNLTHPS